MKGKKFFLLSLVLALVAAGAIYNYLNEMDRQSKSAANLVSVLVAHEEIQAKTKLTESMFTTAEVPIDAIHGDALKEASELTGAYAKERLVAGEQVLSSRLVFEASETGMSYKVSAGHRAVTVPVNSVSGVAGYILPGDFVDAIVTIEDEDGETITKVVEAEILILASGQHTVEEDKELLVVDTVTMDTPADAVTAIIQASERGSLRLVLRPVEGGNDKAVRAHRLSQF